MNWEMQEMKQKRNGYSVNALTVARHQILRLYIYNEEAKPTSERKPTVLLEYYWIESSMQTTLSGLTNVFPSRLLVMYE